MCCYVQRKNHAQSTYHLLVLRFRADKYLLLKRPYHIYEMKQGNEYEYTANCTCCAESASDVPFSSSSSSYKNRSVFFLFIVYLHRFSLDLEPTCMRTTERADDLKAYVLVILVALEKFQYQLIINLPFLHAY